MISLSTSGGRATAVEAAGLGSGRGPACPVGVHIPTPGAVGAAPGPQIDRAGKSDNNRKGTRHGARQTKGR
jgi:hypothetical protein